MRKIVLAFDDSSGSRCARDWCADLAAKEGEVDVTAVYVLSSGGDWALAAMQADTGSLKDQVEKLMDDDWMVPVREAGAKVATLVVEGHPATELLKAADTVDADLLVLGVSGHGGFSGRFLGGVAQKVAHHSSRPVVLVPCPGEGAPIE